MTSETINGKIRTYYGRILVTKINHRAYDPATSGDLASIKQLMSICYGSGSLRDESCNIMGLTTAISIIYVRDYHNYVECWH